MEQENPRFNNVGPGDQPLGSADDVPDTRALPAHGTEPGQPAHGSARARVGNAGGLGGTLWIVLAVIALVVLAIYGLAVVR
jgi:hypothetical protein